MATFDYQISGFELANAKTNLGRLEQIFQVQYMVRTSEKVTIPEVATWLRNNFAWSLSDWGYPTAILDTYSCKPEDENERTCFTGIATYRQSDYSSQQTVVEFGHNVYEEILMRARDEEENEVAVVNSAGDRPEDPLTESYQRQIIRISKCYPLATSPAWFNQFRNTINRNNILIADIPIPRRAGRMVECYPVIQVISQVEYAWRFNLEIEIRNPNEPCTTWDREILDAGMYYLELVTGDAKTALEEKEAAGDPLPEGVVKRGEVFYYKKRHTTRGDLGEVEPSDVPCLLDLHGGKLQDTTPGNEKYIKYQTKDAIDWSQLDLPRTMWEVLFIG